MKITIKLLLSVVFLVGCSPKISQVKTEYRDTIITVNGDTIVKYLSRKELCDTTRDTIFIYKEGRLTSKIVIKRDTVRFECNEDSLRLVIQKVTETKIKVVKEPARWLPWHFIAILLLIVLLVFSINKLIR